MIFLLLSEDLGGGLQMQNDINEPAWLIVARGSIKNSRCVTFKYTRNMS